MNHPPPDPRTVGIRTLRRDGTYNIERRGIPRRRFTQDAYHHFLSLSWRWLMAYIAVAYLTVNALFALAYLALGNAIENARHGSFEDAFFFSVQTMATIGYGKLVPKGFAGNMLVTIESVIGMVGVAVLTGLLFAKFSRPTSRVVFSRNAVVTTQNGVPVLLFRVANERDSMLVEARMHVVIVRGEVTAEGSRMRRFHDLVLTRPETPIFPLSWTVTHVSGVEESISQSIHARFSYVCEDIRFAHHFVDIISIGEDGRRVLDYTHFHDVVPDGLT